MLARRFFAACLLVALVVSPALAGWWDDLDRGESVSLADLIAQHSRYRDRVVSFFCIYHGRDEVFAPLASPFSPQRHMNFAVWKDGVPVWEQEGFKRDYPFLYMGRTHPQLGELSALEMYTRIEVTGRVKGLIRARPCIDVISFRQTGHRLGKQVVQSIMAGDRHAEQGRDELAYDNYLRALQPDLPPAYQLLVEKRVAEGLRRLGRHAEAASIEGGGILGAGGPPGRTGRGQHAPGSLLGDPLPGDPAAASPGGQGRPPLITTDDLPGQPAGASAGTPAGAPPGPGPASPPRDVVTPTGDLPGQPVGPRPFTRDLPGTPAAEAPNPALTAPPTPPAAVPPPLLPPPAPESPARPGPEAPVPPAPPPPATEAPPAGDAPSPEPRPDAEPEATKPPRVPPSRHQPRLSGVK